MFVGDARAKEVIRRRLEVGAVGRYDRVRVGVLYPSMGVAVDCLGGLGWVACHGFSVVSWKRKATGGWKQFGFVGNGGPQRNFT